VTNPLFAPSQLPFAMPPFGKITDDHYAPAFDRGMAEQIAEIAAIVADPAGPTFENTLVPLELSGQLLRRATRVFSNKTSADSTPATDELQKRYAARLAEHQDALRLNSELYRRIKSVYEDKAALDPEQQYLVERYYTEFTLAGAGLSDDAKQRLKELNARLSTLRAEFEQALLADTNELALVVEDASELDGLTASEISAAAAVAEERGLDGKYVINLVLPTGHPYLASLTNRETRRRLYEAQRARGSRGNAYDTRDTLLQMVRMRAERASLLGFESHAAVETIDNTAGSTRAVRDLVEQMSPVVAKNARAEQETLEHQAGFSIEAWDWPYFAERVRKSTYDVDLSALRPHFEAERVLQDGVFFAAGRLFGITFTERTDLAAYHPEVRVFEVRAEDGDPVGLYLLDLYTRDSKNGGAWMDSLVDQSTLLDMPTAIVVNNLNVSKPASGQSTLLTLDETTLLFHEFGHALHGLLARVTYPKLAGTNVFRDFVEFPSQVNEMWMLWPEVLANYAVHFQTGKPLPAAVLDRLKAAETFNEGFNMAEHLAAVLLDLAWHELGPDTPVDDVAAFEAAALNDMGLALPAIPPRYSSPYFAHIFAGDYSAGYYSYLWSAVLEADTVDWFKENGGLTRANGERFWTYVIGIGGSSDPLESFRKFRGRHAALEPLLRRRGLIDPLA